MMQLWVRVTSFMDSRKIGLFIDLITVCVVYFIAYILVALSRGYAAFVHQQPLLSQMCLFILFSWSFSLVVFSEYPTRRSAQIAKEIKSSLRVNLFGALLFSFLEFSLKAVGFSRLFFAVYICLCTLSMMFNRYLIRISLYSLRRLGWDSKSLLLVGTGPGALQYYRETLSNRKFGLHLVGYVGDLQRSIVLPHLGCLTEIDVILTQYRVDGVVLALSLANPEIGGVIRACETQGIPVELLLNDLSSRIASSTIVDTDGVPRLVMAPIPHSLGAIMLKRLTDIVLSGLILLSLAPVFLLVSVAIKIDDRGPVFFSQERVGIHNKTFRIYKFRTMRQGAEQLKQKLLHLNEMSGPVFKIKQDPRVTRVGRYLRQTSLDELPQLWNVFVGDMSLVGPRPPLPDEVAQYDYAHRRRLSVKPGITCLWQISGRNNIDFDEWVNLDLQYIDNWSYFHDWKILLQTIPAVLKGGGAS